MDKYELQKLRDLPITGVAERLGLRVARLKSLCPFHDDHTASLSFCVRRNTCRCFVCMDRSMGTIDLVMRCLGLDFKAACRWLADENNIILEEYKPATAPGNKAADFDAGRYEGFFMRPWLSDEARRFLFDERRLDPRVVSWCRVSSWRDRGGVNWLQTPYYDVNGRLTGVQNRRLGKAAPDVPRFRFPRGSRCGIYNLQIVGRLRKGDELWVAEGCSDAWSLLSSGRKAVAVPSATLLSAKDRELLASLSSGLALQWHMFPDRDAPGERLFMQLKEILPDIAHHRLPPGCKDFSDYYVQLKTEENNG